MRHDEAPIYDDAGFGNGAKREICGAKRKRDGGICRSPAMANGRCHKHGGASYPAGPANPNYVTGKYSKVMPNLKLRERYEKALQDEEWTSLRSEIALLDMRLAELVEAIDIGGAPAEAWRNALMAFTKMDEALITGDIDAAKENRIKLKETLENGFDLVKSWDQLIRVIHDRRLVVESERKRAIELSQVLTMDQSMNLINTVANIIDKFVVGPEAKKGAADLLSSLMTPRNIKEVRREQGHIPAEGPFSHVVEATGRMISGD